MKRDAKNAQMLEVPDVKSLELNSKCSRSVERNMAMVFYFILKKGE
jgi:hypothetical protein